MEWSRYQQDIFEAVAGTADSLIIEAVAGSGKTTTIVEAIKHVPSSQSVAFLAFNKSIADELKRRVTQPNARCMTLHSVGLTAWKQHLEWDANDLEIDGKKTRAIIDALELPYGQWTTDMTKCVSLAKGVGLVPRGFLDAKGLVADDEDTWFDLMEMYNLDYDQVDLDLVRKVLELSIAQSRTIVDFDDMLYMPIVADVAFEKQDVVFLDEAQDVNGIQAEIVSRMLGPGSRVIVVGDSRQAIYGFRGALSDSMSQLGRRFDCRSMPLTISYRCPKSVVRKARQWVKHIEAFEGAPEGLTQDPANDWLLKSFLPGDAILCRNARPVVEAAFLLIRNKIPAKVAGRDIGQGLVKLVEKMKARTIADLAERLAKYRVREVTRMSQKKGSESKIALLDDKLDTLHVFMEEAGPHAGIATLIAAINALFGDNGGMTGAVHCSTVHKAKGLEWDRVFVLDADLYMPSKWAKQDWERRQEDNLCYVAATRAKRELRYVTSEGLRMSLEKVQDQDETTKAHHG